MRKTTGDTKRSRLSSAAGCSLESARCDMEILEISEIQEDKRKKKKEKKMGGAALFLDELNAKPTSIERGERR